MDDVRQTVDAARGLMPAWTAFGPFLLWVPSGFACTWLATWVTSRIALGRLGQPEAGFWVERARVVFPAAVSSGIMGLAAATSFALLAYTVTGPLAAGPPALLAICVAVAGLLGSFAARRVQYERARGRPLGWARGLRGELHLLLLLFPHVLLTGSMVVGVPAEPHGVSLLVAGFGLGAFGLVACFGGLPLVRLLGGTRPPPARLERAIAASSTRLGVPLPRAVYTFVAPQANAFAFPLSRTLAFTGRALDVLDDTELEAIAAHELAHLSEPARVRAARAGAVLALVPVALWNPLAHLLGIGGAIALVVASWLVLLRVRTMALRMERRADTFGVDAERGPGCYARALEHLHEANLTPAVMAGRRPTHPHLYDRLLAAGVEPDYPRPAPPTRLRAQAGVGVGCALLTLCALCVLMLPGSLSVLPEDPRRGVTWSIALSGGSAENLFSLALVTDPPRDAVVLLRASSALDADLHYPPAYLAELLGDLGRCDESETSLATAEQRLRRDALDADPWLESARLALGECWNADETEREA